MSKEKRLRYCRKQYSLGVYLVRIRDFSLALGLMCLLVMPRTAIGKAPILSASEIDYPPFCIVDYQGRAGGFSVELMRAALEIPSHRRIVIGGDHNYPPYEYLNENGRPAGFIVELTRAIAREMNLDIQIRLGPWAEIVKSLENGEIDAIQGMFYSPECNLKFDFTQPHTVNHYVGVVRQGESNPPASIVELKGKRIVLQRGDIIHDYLLKNGLGDHVSLVETQEDVLRELAEGSLKVVASLARRLFGKKEEELLGQKFMPLVHEEDRRPIDEAMKALSSPPHTAYIEQRAMTKEGWLWLAWVDTAVLDNRGNVKEIIGVGRDITERKQAEEVLNEAESLYRLHFENVSDIITGKAAFDEAYCADHAGFVPGEFALLAVSDDGSGMDKETLDNLFEPFFTTKGVGTGLGLATVYGIVKQNNGFINVYSEPGKGSTFKIYLPRHAGAAEKTEKEDPAGIPPGRSETVLIVEDEISILRLAKRILERLGYTVLESSTMGRAMDLAQEHAGEIHLLITDVVMPEMNGCELAERLQSLYPDLKVLFMSGYTADVIAHREVLDAGVHFMQKPFSSRDLAIKVREALDT